MDPEEIVFDISSDDEPGWVGPGESWAEDTKADSYDWLSEVLSTVDGGSDDPDEVVFIGEVNPTRKLKSSQSSIECISDDDECVVLDGDPDKPLEIANQEEEACDELQIVGQKGEIACRDLPHSRHLCAKFKFDSTSHTKHCELCHCFVCDTLAPCIYWGAGISTTDHCHATDEEKRWNLLRQSVRQMKNPTAQNQVSTTNTRDVVLGETIRNQISTTNTRDVVLGATIPNQVSRPSILRPCSSSTRVPNIMKQPGGRQAQITDFVLKRINLQPRRRSVPVHSLAPRNTAIRKDRVHGVSTGSQFISSRITNSVEDGGVGVTMNKAAYGSSDSISSAPAAWNLQNSAAITTASNENPIGWHDICPVANQEPYMLQRSSQPNMGSFYTNSESSHPAVSSQPIPQSCFSQPTIIGEIGSVNDSSRSFQQPSSDNIQPQTEKPTNEQISIKELDDRIRFHFEDDLDLDFLLEDQYFPVVQEGSVHPEPPEPVMYDPGMPLFDFEAIGMA